jgi:tellurite methyltransferase
MATATKGITGILTLFGLVIAATLYENRLVAGPVRGDSLIGDKSNYEAITGESADEDRSAWDSFYRHKKNQDGQEPIGFLKANIQSLGRGRAFVPAMGEGRNAIYLAKMGFEVDGNDVSDVAIEKAMAEARRQKVSVKPILADLNDYSIPEGHYDLVVLSLFYSKSVIQKLKKSVRRGGHLLVYNRTEDPSAKKKSDAPSDFLVQPAEIKEQLKDFEIRVFKEYEDQGFKVVGVIARKTK